MIIYNVTVIIDYASEQEWLNWMRSKHIPDVMNTAHFLECRLSKIHAEDQGGQSYAISYVSESEDKLKAYHEKFAEALQKEHTEKFQGRFAAFRTTMSIVEEFKP